MKVLITNTVALNGGDFAILESIIRLIKSTYGNETEFIVYDADAKIASKYYSKIDFRKALYVKYKGSDLKRFRDRFKGISNKVIDLYNSGALYRLMIAAKLSSKGGNFFANYLLSKEQRIDFDNYRSADIIISTGGTYLVENYGMESRIFDYHFTLALNKPLIFFTQSLGPFKLSKNKIPLKGIFSKAELVLLRDKASFDNLKDIDVNITKARICADVVFADAVPAILEEAKFKKFKEPLKIGISVRDWKYFKNRSQHEGMEIYCRSIAAICEYITNRLCGEVKFISTCQGIQEYHNDDSRTAKRIYELLSAKAKERTSVDTDFHTPDELKARIKKLDIVISTRMHMAIQSLNVGVPVLPIAYEFKTKELFGKLINKELILDIDTIEEEQAIDVFKLFLIYLSENRAQLFDKVIKEHHSSLLPVQYLKEELNF